jgi:hypothetical protein
MSATDEIPPVSDAAVEAVAAFAGHFGIEDPGFDAGVWGIDIGTDTRIAFFAAPGPSLACAIGGAWFDTEDPDVLQELAAGNLALFARHGGTVALDDDERMVYLRRLPMEGIDGEQVIYLVSEMIGTLEEWAERWRDDAVGGASEGEAPSGSAEAAAAALLDPSRRA